MDNFIFLLNEVLNSVLEQSLNWVTGLQMQF